MLERQRGLEEEKRQIESDFKKNEKKAQEIILNKKNSRPKLSFGLKSVPKWKFYNYGSHVKFYYWRGWNEGGEPLLLHSAMLSILP